MVDPLHVKYARNRREMLESCQAILDLEEQLPTFETGSRAVMG